jgi:ACR3 family arsenite transporter
MPLRHTLEHHQITLYVAAVAAGAVLAWAWPGTAAWAPAIDPLLALMLFATFLQVPLAALRRAVADRRFLAALLLANFVAVPLLVAALLPWLPPVPLLRLGVALVLLAPCIDYVVTFAQMGRADERALLAATPVLLALQMLLLPVFLPFMLGEAAAGLVRWQPFAHAFVVLIAVPLALAAACQAWAARTAAGARVVERMGLLPVPATAAVLCVVVAAMAPLLGPARGAALAALPVYLAFAALAPMLGWGVARVCGLAAPQGRAVAFSSATRNSLVVLPLALAVPGAVPLLPAVIVLQTLVELLCELAYVRWLARWGRQSPP